MSTSTISIKALAKLEESGAFSPKRCTGIAQIIDEKPSVMARTIKGDVRLTSCGWVNIMSLINSDYDNPIQAESALRGVFGEPVPTSEMERKAKERGLAIEPKPFNVGIPNDTLFVKVPQIVLPNGLNALHVGYGWEVTRDGGGDNLEFMHSTRWDAKTDDPSEWHKQWRGLNIDSFEMALDFDIFAARWLPREETASTVSTHAWGQPKDLATFVAAHTFTGVFPYKSDSTLEPTPFAPLICNNAKIINEWWEALDVDSMNLKTDATLTIADDFDRSCKIDFTFGFAYNGTGLLNIAFGGITRHYYGNNRRVQFSFEKPNRNRALPFTWGYEKQNEIANRADTLARIYSEYHTSTFEKAIEGGLEWNGHTVTMRYIGSSFGRSIEVELTYPDGTTNKGHRSSIIEEMACITEAGNWKPLSTTLTQEVIEVATRYIRGNYKDDDEGQLDQEMDKAIILANISPDDKETVDKFFMLFRDYSNAKNFWELVNIFERGDIEVARIIDKLETQIKAPQSRKTGLDPALVVALSLAMPVVPKDKLGFAYRVIVELLFNHKKNFNAGRYSFQNSYSLAAHNLIVNTINRAVALEDVENMKAVLLEPKVKQRAVFSLNEGDTRSLFSAWETILNL